MRPVLALSYGELILKGKNRGAFIRRLQKDLDRAFGKLSVEEAFSQEGKLFYAFSKDQDLEKAIQEAKKVFGLIYITPAWQIEKNLDLLRETAAKLVAQKKKSLQDPGRPITFKVLVKRADKTFPYQSPQLAAMVGGWILEDLPGLAVDVKYPDILLRLEVREDFFLSTDRYQAMGGMPAGSAGRGLLLLSGGIDSPVAGFALAKRGLALGALHFHSYPFTSERAKDKAMRLAKQMASYTGPLRLFMVNLLDSYTAIHQKSRKKDTTLLSRRMMVRIANRICQEEGYQAILTGESLGQVASQTMEGISVVNAVAQVPILRPLIARDKSEIIEMARQISTYDISIEPYDDCCSIFAPDHPNTKPKLSDLLRDEEDLDIDQLVEKALASLEIVDVKG